MELKIADNGAFTMTFAYGNSTVTVFGRSASTTLDDMQVAHRVCHLIDELHACDVVSTKIVNAI